MILKQLITKNNNFLPIHDNKKHLRPRISPSSTVLLKNCFAVASIFLLFLPSNSMFVSALKCKCTQNSPKTPCNNGVCEVSNDSACLMLDHPNSGRHYACSTAQLKEGECTEKISKSGAAVQVCSCNSSDLCNFKMWPKQNDDLDEEDEWIPIGKGGAVKSVNSPSPPPNKAASTGNTATLFVLLALTTLLSFPIFNRIFRQHII